MLKIFFNQVLFPCTCGNHWTHGRGWGLGCAHKSRTSNCKGSRCTVLLLKELDEVEAPVCIKLLHWIQVRNRILVLVVRGENWMLDQHVLLLLRLKCVIVFVIPGTHYPFGLNLTLLRRSFIRLIPVRVWLNSNLFINLPLIFTDTLGSPLILLLFTPPRFLLKPCIKPVPDFLMLKFLRRWVFFIMLLSLLREGMLQVKRGWWGLPLG